MDNDQNNEEEKLAELEESLDYAITCLIRLIRNRLETEAEFWDDLLKCFEEEK